MTVGRVCVEEVPGATGFRFSQLRLVQVLKSRVGPIFFFFRLLIGSLWHSVLVNMKGVKRTPWASLFVGKRDSSSSSLGEGKPAPEVVTPVPSLLSLLPPLLLHYCRPLLCWSLRIHNMAYFRKAYFDQRIGTNTVAADSDEKQTVPCAKRGRRGRKNNPECSLPLALVPCRYVLADLSLENDTI